MRVKDFPKPIRNFLWKYMVFRPAIVYAYSCSISSKRETWAYIGQTRQQLTTRHNQHMGYDPRQPAQPWSDLYPEIRIEWQGSCPDFILDAIEKFFIKKYKPLFNYIHNTKNPDRITKYQAKHDRQERDLRRRWDHGRVIS